MSGSFKCTRRLRLKPVFTAEKTKWFRWVTWGMFLYAVNRPLYTSDVCSFVQIKARLWFIPHSILHTGQIWPLSLFVLHFGNLNRSSPWQNNSCWPPLSNQKRPLALFLSSFHTLFLSCLYANNVCLMINVISGKFCIATEQNNYIFIYVQWKWMHTSYIVMEQTFRTLTLD